MKHDIYQEPHLQLSHVFAPLLHIPQNLKHLILKQLKRKSI